VVRAACRRLDLAALLAVTAAGAATAIYVDAEGVRRWPVLWFDTTSGTLRDHLDPAVAQAAVPSRDGLHAPASVLPGVSVLAIAGCWPMRPVVRGHPLMSALSVVAGGFAVSSVRVGPDGQDPGIDLALSGPVVAVSCSSAGVPHTHRGIRRVTRPPASQQVSRSAAPKPPRREPSSFAAVRARLVAGLAGEARGLGSACADRGRGFRPDVPIAR
jgi:hypothetical protein